MLIRGGIHVARGVSRTLQSITARGPARLLEYEPIKQMTTVAMWV
jgi:hypothetical protein